MPFAYLLEHGDFRLVEAIGRLARQDVGDEHLDRVVLHVGFVHQVVLDPGSVRSPRGRGPPL
jgi:hypothetical protein